MSTRRVPAWPVAVLALPAAVAIWSGWVGLGGMTGFGVVQLLPGIWDGARINTAITLPIGMEAYAAYALKAWLTPGTPVRAREFAKASAIGALILGALGQVGYHLMAAAHITAAPWPITAVVACLPVAVLGMGAALAHLLGDEDDTEAQANDTRRQPLASPAAPQPVLRPGGFQPPRASVVAAPFSAVPNLTTARPAEGPEMPERNVSETSRPAVPSRPVDRRAARPARRSRPAAKKPATDEQLAETVREMAAENGQPPTPYQVKTALGVGHARAARLVAELSPAGPPSSNGAARKEGTK